MLQLGQSVAVATFTVPRRALNPRNPSPTHQVHSAPPSTSLPRPPRQPARTEMRIPLPTALLRLPGQRHVETVTGPRPLAMSQVIECLPGPSPRELASVSPTSQPQQVSETTALLSTPDTHGAPATAKQQRQTREKQATPPGPAGSGSAIWALGRPHPVCKVGSGGLGGAASAGTPHTWGTPRPSLSTRRSHHPLA